MKFEATTLKDIAQALGLSTSTVSRALRQSYEVSEETRQRVFEYAQKLNYHPNPIALSLRERKSRSIGVIVSEIANSFFSQAINGIESIAYDRDYHVVISQSHESYDREILSLQNLAARSIDGLLISLSTETNDMSHLRDLHERGFPIVFFDRVTTDIKTHQVIVDNLKGAYDATTHLIGNGYRRIATLNNSAYLSITTERLAGYQKALADHHIKVQPGYIKYCKHGGLLEDEIEKAVQQLLKLKQLPEAIFAAGDKLTTGCLRALRKKGLRVPQDIALVGFSNSDISELLDPPLTTVRQPAFEMGQIAIDLLIRQIESKRPVTDFEKKVLSTRLLIRDSSMPPKPAPARRR